MKKATPEKKTARVLRREKNWYGMKKLKVGQKVCWLASENKNGWALGLALGKRTLWLRNLRVKTRSEVERLLSSSVVFIHTKDSKEVPQE